MMHLEAGELEQARSAWLRLTELLEPNSSNSGPFAESALETAYIALGRRRDAEAIGRRLAEIGFHERRHENILTELAKHSMAGVAAQ